MGARLAPETGAHTQWRPARTSRALELNGAIDDQRNALRCWTGITLDSVGPGAGATVGARRVPGAGAGRAKKKPW